MKKAVVLLLALTMLFCLAACGSSGSQGGGSATPPASTPGTTAPSTPSPGTPSAPEGPPTGPEGQEYGGILKIASTASYNEPFGVPWLFISFNRPFAAFGEALLLESTFGDIVPFLAESWEPDWENAEVRFKLREDVTFTDGTKFNAESAAWNMNKWRDEGLLDPAVLHTEIRGEYEITTHLSWYSNWVPNTFASRLYCFVSPSNYEKNGGDFAAENPVGTGPYKMKERSPGSHVKFERNDNYWQQGMPYLDGVEYYSLTDPLVQAAALMSTGDDRIDAVATSSGELITSVVGSADVYLKSAPSGPISFIPSSRDEGSPLAKLEVRQAIAYAVDRQAICDARGFGIWTPGTQIIASGFMGHLPDSYDITFDPAKSKELLSQAGYPNGFAVTVYASASIDRDAMVAIQSMLGDVGITANLEFPEAGAVSELRQNWTGLFVNSIGAFPNMTSMFGMYFDPDYLYYPRMWRPDDIADLYKQSRTTELLDPRLLEAYHAKLMENMLAIPLYNLFSSYIIRNEFHDTGFTEWGSGTQWTSWRVWRSSK